MNLSILPVMMASTMTVICLLTVKIPQIAALMMHVTRRRVGRRTKSVRPTLSAARVGAKTTDDVDKRSWEPLNTS